MVEKRGQWIVWRGWGTDTRGKVRAIIQRIDRKLNKVCRSWTPVDDRRVCNWTDLCCHPHHFMYAYIAPVVFSHTHNSSLLYSLYCTCGHVATLLRTVQMNALDHSAQSVTPHFWGGNLSHMNRCQGPFGPKN